MLCVNFAFRAFLRGVACTGLTRNAYRNTKEEAQPPLCVATIGLPLCVNVLGLVRLGG